MVYILLFLELNKATKEIPRVQLNYDSHAGSNGTLARTNDIARAQFKSGLTATDNRTVQSPVLQKKVSKIHEKKFSDRPGDYN